MKACLENLPDQVGAACSFDNGLFRFHLQFIEYDTQHIQHMDVHIIFFHPEERSGSRGFDLNIRFWRLDDGDNFIGLNFSAVGFAPSSQTNFIPAPRHAHPADFWQKYLGDHVNYFPGEITTSSREGFGSKPLSGNCEVSFIRIIYCYPYHPIFAIHRSRRGPASFF
jgi:hypothetical protein